MLDWNSSFAFKNPATELGYTYRTGMGTRGDIAFIATPSPIAQEVAMIDNFAALVSSSEPNSPMPHSRRGSTSTPCGSRQLRNRRLAAR